MLTVHKHKITLVKDKAQKEKSLETDGTMGGTALFQIVEPLPPDRRCGMIRIPYINTAATGRNIDRMRREAGFSVKDLQAVFGFATPQAIYKWIHGDAIPSIDNLVILAAVLETTMDEIIVVDIPASRCG